MEAGQKRMKKTYKQVLEQGGNAWEEKRTVTTQVAEYTLALILNTQLTGSSGYQYKNVTNESTFNFVLKLLEYLQAGVEAVKNALYNVFHWTDFLTGGTSGGDTYIGNIDANVRILSPMIRLEKGVKKVVYYNQGEDPWATMSYGASTIKSLWMRSNIPCNCNFNINRADSDSGDDLRVFHYKWGIYLRAWNMPFLSDKCSPSLVLNCERVGKDRMGDVVNALKDGKWWWEICRPTPSRAVEAGILLLLTGVTKKMVISRLPIVPVGNVLGKCIVWKQLLLTAVTWQMEPFGSFGNERVEYGRTLEMGLVWDFILLH